jgi:hypothetical protein
MRRTGPIVALLLAWSATPALAGSPDAMAFWGRQRKGANCQNVTVSPAYWSAAAEAHIEFVRLLPDAWPAAGRDFLLGSADRFEAIDPRDLKTLTTALDDAERAGVKVVLTMLSLPGARTKQLNGDRDDARLWRDDAFQDQAAAFWRSLAARLGRHPALVAYSPLNEPHPERGFGFEDPGDAGYAAWRERTRGTPADMDRFNARIVEAIRSVDPDTPILLDGPFYAAPQGLALLAPVRGRNLLYAFHFYDEWEYTTFRVNAGRHRYPDRMPRAGGAGPWAPDEIAKRVEPVARWADANGIQRTRIVAAEFGVDRRVGGAAEWLKDVLAALDARGWHWAFYAFRSDGEWSGLDYELGTAPIDPRVWGALERGEDPERYKKRIDNPLWRLLTSSLAAPR